MLGSAVCKTLRLFALLSLPAIQLHVRQAALQYRLGMHMGMGMWLAMVVAAGVVICIAVVLFVHPAVGGA
jgi:hypothetical protein